MPVRGNGRAADSRLRRAGTGHPARPAAAPVRNDRRLPHYAATSLARTPPRPLAGQDHPALQDLPPHTPQGSSRSRASAQAGPADRAGAASALACSRSAGSSANHRSASVAWHGTRIHRAEIATWDSPLSMGMGNKKPRTWCPWPGFRVRLGDVGVHGLPGGGMARTGAMTRSGGMTRSCGGDHRHAFSSRGNVAAEVSGHRAGGTNRMSRRNRSVGLPNPGRAPPIKSGRRNDRGARRATPWRVHRRRRPFAHVGVGVGQGHQPLIVHAGRRQDARLMPTASPTRRPRSRWPACSRGSCGSGVGDQVTAPLTPKPTVWAGSSYSRMMASMASMALSLTCSAAASA